MREIVVVCSDCRVCSSNHLDNRVGKKRVNRDK